MLTILFIGDVFGAVGRRCLGGFLPRLVEQYRVDLVVANGENSAGGLGINAKTAQDMLDAGVDLITTGNHIWKQKGVEQYLDQEPRVLRPANYPPGTPGQGYALVESAAGVLVAVVNLQGRVFMNPLPCPFHAMDDLLGGPLKDARAVCVDFHAEATSEKQAFARYMDGRISAVLGTHTHVQTADEKVLPGGTAYISDLGMTGPQDSVIGMRAEVAVKRFITQIPQGFRAAKDDPWLQGAVVSLDEKTGSALSIERLNLKGGQV